MRERSTEHARDVLLIEGFAVEDIPEAASGKRADLRVRWLEEEYVLEAKLRAPRREWLELMEKADTEGYATASRNISPWASLSSTIREAHQQLVATPAGRGAFRILWIAALNDDDRFIVACLEKRLLGTARVVIIDPHTLSVTTSTCYHHGSNDFELCAGIDAAVLCTCRDATLFVNYFSERREAFRKSQLHRMFDRHGAVVDPEIEVTAGTALMLGSDFVGPRAGGHAQWKYLLDRYGVRSSPMMESQFWGMATARLGPASGG